MDQLISLWGKSLVLFPDMKSRHKSVTRDQLHYPQAGRTFTFLLQKKIKILIIIGPPPQSNANNQIKILVFQLGSSFDRSECEGRQNARQRVRFDKIFASFSSIGKGRASPA